MRKIANIKWLPVLMALTILVISGFQVYWIQRTYEREKRTLEMRSNFLFRESVLSLQASKLKLDRLMIDSAAPQRIFVTAGDSAQPVRIKLQPGQRHRVINMVNTIRRKVSDTEDGETVVFERHMREQKPGKTFGRKENRLMQFLYDVDSLQDSVRIAEVEKTFSQKLEQQNMDVPFEIRKLQKERDDRAFNEVTLGFAKPITFQLQLGNSFPYLLKRISAAILFSLFLVGVTILSFTLLYRNLLRQRRLANIKNEFISNITHELKTPIATVSVAIEALRSFNASIDPQRTKEYLDISANELQRLSLLVDKVLKLSMFEKREVELKYEALDMSALVDEVITSLRLQFEKHRADVSVTSEGDTTLQADRLHLVSVIFNLLDNALKYSNSTPEISITIKEAGENVQLLVADKGIGIPVEYQDKVFEKFFRVPTGNLHNAKGYGLGLSYVAHVIEKHHGTIRVQSEEGAGSTFIITLPKNQA